MTLQEMIGQRLMTGFPGTEMSPEFCQAVRKHKIGNVILFRENIRDRQQLKTLCRDIQELVRRETGHPAFIAIDQEGGVVSRLPEDAVNVPGAMALGATGVPENACMAGKLIGRELRALGPNFNFAPTVDVNSNPHNPVIGVRSYGDDPEKVGQFAAQAVKGLMEGGVLCTAKHFPGHGDTNQDSHLSLPTVNKSLAELEKVEWVPFRRAIAAGIPAVMTAHILFPQLEPEKVPATMSRTILQGYLRQKLGFDGLIVSDCMQMKAIANHYGTVEGTLAAFRAGVDLVEITHDATLCAQAAVKALEAAQAGTLDMGEMEESVRRILELKARWVENFPEPAFDFAQAAAESRSLMEKTITQLHKPEGFSLGDRPLCIGCDAYRVSLVGNVAEDGSPFAREMAALLGGTGAQMTQDPQTGEIESLVARAKNHSSAVVGTYNGHLRPGQLELVRALANNGVATVVVALRNPYDLRDVPENTWRIAAYEYSTESIRAVARLLLGQSTATGTLPVQMEGRNEHAGYAG